MYERGHACEECEYVGQRTVSLAVLSFYNVSCFYCCTHVFYAVWPVNLLSVLSLPHFTVECWDSDVCHQIQLFFFFFKGYLFIYLVAPPHRPSWNSLCRIRIRLAFGLRSACFCLLTAKIKGVYWLSVL